MTLVVPIIEELSSLICFSLQGHIFLMSTFLIVFARIWGRLIKDKEEKNFLESYLSDKICCKDVNNNEDKTSDADDIPGSSDKNRLYYQLSKDDMDDISEHEEEEQNQEEDGTTEIINDTSEKVILGQTFFWPAHSEALETVRHTPSGISQDLKLRLGEMGILREETKEVEEIGVKVEEAARLRGAKLTRKQVRVIFDTFLAKSRPGLEISSEEEADMVVKERKGKKEKGNFAKKRKSYVKFVKPLTESSLVRAF